MNLNEIYEEINKDVDDTLDNEDLKGWINRCMDELSPYAKYQQSTVISLEKDKKEYDLPSDFLEMGQLVDGTKIMYQLPLKNLHSKGFKLWGNKLIIQPTPTESKNLDLYYRAKLPHLENMDDEPQIPSPFHDLFILYTVAKRQYQDDEQELRMAAWSDYQARKQEFISFCRKTQPETIRDVYGVNCYGY